MGDRRIGVALSDPLGVLASPLLVFEHQDDSTDIAFVLKLVAEHNVERLIVGLPQSMDGTLGTQAEKVKNFAEKLRKASPVPLEYRDERLTTVTAKRLMQEGRTRKSAKNKNIEYDAAAAAIILQSYLNEARPLEFPEDT